MKTCVAILAGMLMTFGAASAEASPLAIDEATYPGAGGDYNNLLNPPLPAAVIFNLDAGTNTFSGSFGTPGDAGDTFALKLGVGQLLTGIHVSFATNANDFNPVAINQDSYLVFDSASSSSPMPLLALGLSGKPSAPVTFSSAAMSVGPGLYTATMLTGVLALNSNARVGYQVAFDVTGSVTPQVPEPSEFALMGAGLLVLLPLLRRRMRRAHLASE